MVVISCFSSCVRPVIPELRRTSFSISHPSNAIMIRGCVKSSGRHRKNARLEPPRLSPGSRGESDFRQVDRGLAFVGRVIAHPEQITLQNHACIAAIATAWQDQLWRDRLEVHATNEGPALRRLAARLAATGDHSTSREHEEIWTTDSQPGGVPTPSLVRCLADADPGLVIPASRKPLSPQ